MKKADELKPLEKKLSSTIIYRIFLVLLIITNVITFSVFYLIKSNKLDEKNLDALIIIEKGIRKTVENFSQKNNLYYGLFSKAATENKAKAKNWNDKAMDVKAKADATVKVLYDIRKIIIKTSGGDESLTDISKIQLKDNADFCSQIMVKEGKGDLLRNQIEDFRKNIISHVAEPEKHIDLIKSIEKILDTSDPNLKEGIQTTWITEKFQGLPLISCFTFMTLLESNIRNAEADILGYLYFNLNQDMEQ